jgi:peptide/nickel transport system substrate-binding protein
VHLNPHWATGTKEQEGSRVFYEPLAGWDADGNLVPVLAAEVPTRDNGGLSADGKSVVWKLKRGVTWHDGQPFTADDVVFNWEFCKDPASGVEHLDLPRHHRHEDRLAHRARPVPEGHAVLGRSLRRHGGHDPAAPPVQGLHGRQVARSADEPEAGGHRARTSSSTSSRATCCAAWPTTGYHIANRPHFDAIEMKGGGDAIGAARAVLQTGEYDYAWNLQVEDEILKRWKPAARARCQHHRRRQHRVHPAQLHRPLERGRRRARQRQEQAPGLPGQGRARGHGPADRPQGRAGLHLRPHRRGHGQLPEQPAALQQQEPEVRVQRRQGQPDPGGRGWKKGADGIRAKGNVKLKFVYQTSVNQPRQKTQAIIKDACAKAGIDLELKSVTAAVFFGGDFANPDTYQKFWADMEMYTTTMTQPDPQVFMEQYCSWEFAQKANKWAGPQHQPLAQRRVRQHAQGRAGRARPGQARRDVHQDERPGLRRRLRAAGGLPTARLGRGQQAGGALSGWDNDMWALPHWYKEA